MPLMFDYARPGKRERLVMGIEEFKKVRDSGYCQELALKNSPTTRYIKDLRDSFGISWDDAINMYLMHEMMGILHEEQKEIRDSS